MGTTRQRTTSQGLADMNKLAMRYLSFASIKEIANVLEQTEERHIEINPNKLDLTLIFSYLAEFFYSPHISEQTLEPYVEKFNLLVKNKVKSQKKPNNLFEKRLAYTIISSIADEKEEDNSTFKAAYFGVFAALFSDQTVFETIFEIINRYSADEATKANLLKNFRLHLDHDLIKEIIFYLGRTYCNMSAEDIIDQLKANILNNIKQAIQLKSNTIVDQITAHRGKAGEYKDETTNQSDEMKETFTRAITVLQKTANDDGQVKKLISQLEQKQAIINDKIARLEQKSQTVADHPKTAEIQYLRKKITDDILPLQELVIQHEQRTRQKIAKFQAMAEKMSALPQEVATLKASNQAKAAEYQAKLIQLTEHYQTNHLARLTQKLEEQLEEHFDAIVESHNSQEQIEEALTRHLDSLVTHQGTDILEQYQAEAQTLRDHLSETIHTNYHASNVSLLTKESSLLFEITHVDDTFKYLVVELQEANHAIADLASEVIAVEETIFIDESNEEKPEEKKQPNAYELSPIKSTAQITSSSAMLTPLRSTPRQAIKSPARRMSDHISLQDEISQAMSVASPEEKTKELSESIEDHLNNLLKYTQTIAKMNYEIAAIKDWVIDHTTFQYEQAPETIAYIHLAKIQRLLNNLITKLMRRAQETLPNDAKPMERPTSIAELEQIGSHLPNIFREAKQSLIQACNEFYQHISSKADVLLENSCDKPLREIIEVVRKAIKTAKSHIEDKKLSLEIPYLDFLHDLDTMSRDELVPRTKKILMAIYPNAEMKLTANGIVSAKNNIPELTDDVPLSEGLFLTIKQQIIPICLSHISYPSLVIPYFQRFIIATFQVQSVDSPFLQTNREQMLLRINELVQSRSQMLILAQELICYLSLVEIKTPTQGELEHLQRIIEAPSNLLLRSAVISTIQMLAKIHKIIGISSITCDKFLFNCSPIDCDELISRIKILDQQQITNEQLITIFENFAKPLNLGIQLRSTENGMTKIDYRSHLDQARMSAIFAALMRIQTSEGAYQIQLTAFIKRLCTFDFNRSIDSKQFIDCLREFLSNLSQHASVQLGISSQFFSPIHDATMHDQMIKQQVSSLFYTPSST